MSRQERRARRRARRDTRQDARRDRRDERREGRQERRDERRDGRRERQDERQEFRDERRDARRDARDQIRDLRRDDDLSRRERRDAISDARDERSDTIDVARQDRRDAVTESRQDQRSAVQTSRREQREEIGDLRVPTAGRNVWKSYLDVQTVRAVEVYRPETLGHLQRISELAAEHDVTIKAVGSGHSFSEVTTTDGYLVETDRLDAILSLDSDARRARLKPQFHNSENLVEVEVGIKIIELSKALEPMGLALRNQGTYDGQTLWGAVSTSTHGSGIAREPFPDAIVSMVVVGENGRTCRIEPSDGITDPTGWAEPDIDELIQDDRVFYSQVCSFGSMGMTYSAVVDCRDFYWLDEWGFVTTWEIFKEEYSDHAALEELLASWDTFECLVMPTAVNRGGKDGVDFADAHPMSLTFRRETDERRTIGSAAVGNLVDPLTKALEGTIVDGPGPLGGKAEGRWWRPQLARLLRGRAALTAIRSVGKKGWDGGDLDPADKPIKRRDKCYKIFPKGGKLFGGYGVELAFPIADTVPIMDRIIELAEENKEDRLFHSAPVAVRFVAPSMAYASPQYERQTVMFEVLMTKGTRDSIQALERIERELIDEPNCRVHWGLHLDRMDSDNFDFQAAYPRWPDFVQTFEDFNADGTFENDFTDRIGLS